MSVRHVIVDGSNLATEGRNMPSLAQLDQAVREFIAENPDDQVTVVVDASFGHRIDPSELADFEGAEAAGEVVSPPAGAIGRGDAFLLRIAEKTGATVLSNDSFQEFHGEHVWLFEKGRLVGGKPVPGVGWIFMDRTPVRGAKSREVTKEAKRKKRVEADVAGAKHPPESRPKSRPKAIDRAIARATEEVVEPASGSKSRRRRSSVPPAEPVNEPLAFITFIAAHPLGSDVVGSVLEYSSHGAFIEADGARCYIPLSAMASPPPRRAREVVTKGEARTFVVQAFDPPRRGVELALPGFARVAGSPTAETVEAEIAAEPDDDEELSGVGAALAAPAEAEPVKRAPRRRAAAKTAAGEAEPASRAAARPSVDGRPMASEGAGPEDLAGPLTGQSGPARKVAARKAASRKAVGEGLSAATAVAPRRPAADKAATAQIPAGSASVATPARKSPARRVAAEQTAVSEVTEAEGSTPRRAAAGRSVGSGRSVAGQVPAEKAPAAKGAAKKAAPRKAAADEAPAEKAPAGQTGPRKAPAERAAGKASVSKATASKAGAGKATGGKTAAGKAAAPKTAAPKAAAKKAPAEKAAPKKAPAERAAPNKAASKKAAAGKAAAGKAAAGKAAATKATPRKSAADKATPTKAVGDTSVVGVAAGKAASRKAAPRKASVEQAAPREAPVEKAATKATARPAGRRNPYSTGRG